MKYLGTKTDSDSPATKGDLDAAKTFQVVLSPGTLYVDANANGVVSSGVWPLSGTVSLKHANSVLASGVTYSVVANPESLDASIDSSGNWSINGSSAADIYYSYCKLRLHCDGANGSTTFTDTSPNPKTVTAYNGAALSTSRPANGAAAGEFDGTDDYISLANSADFNVAASNWTFRCKFIPDVVTGYQAIVGYANGSASNSNYAYQILLSGDEIQANVYSGTTAFGGITAAANLVAGTEYELAVERYSNTLKVYLNGVEKGSWACNTTANNPSGAALHIGRIWGYYPFNGMIDEIDFIVGEARYKGEYTPVDEAFPDTEFAWPTDGSKAKAYVTMRCTYDGTNYDSDLYVVKTRTGSAASLTETLSNKTLVDPAITGTVKEDIYTIVDGAAFEIDPGNGSVQVITLGASRTPKATNFLDGESVTMMIADGTAYTITWTNATFGGTGVKWVGGTAPTLATTGFTVVQLWKYDGQVYGARVGDVA